jgi:hypothetical protein
MPDPVVRPRNALMLFKLETTVGTDASPAAAADSVPFEIDSLEYNSPFTSEDSSESTGTLVKGATLIIGQPFTVKFKARIKGANTAYSAGVRPPHHALLQACGKRGQFTAAVASSALAAGSTTSATLGTTGSATAQAHRFMRALISGAGANNGAMPMIADYTAAKVATLTDTMPAALSTSFSASIPGNWVYAGTSPVDFAARTTDHPSGTWYLYEDGQLIQGVGFRGRVTMMGEDAAPGMFQFELTGIFVGRTNAAIPSGAVLLGHSAPILVQGSAVLPAFSVNRKPLPIASWSIEEAAEMESPDDPNTLYGFAPAEIGGRGPMLKCDPLLTQLSVRDHLAELQAGANYVGVIRCGAVATNRWAITLPQLLLTKADPGKRGMNRSEALEFQCLHASKDSLSRDSDWGLVFD